jgi:RNA methyltransferase, TrmH family
MELSKARIQYIQSLKIKKYRQSYTSFIVEGEKMAKEILIAANNTPEHIDIESIYATETWMQDNSISLRPLFSKCLTITERELKTISSLTTPNKVLIIVKIRAFEWNEQLIREHFSFYLDGIQDPGNMGTILRIADWFGMPYVFCSDTCVDVYNPKVVQASMGAFLRVNTTEISFAELVSRYPNLPTYATSMVGDNIFDTPSFPKGIIAIGNEGSGLNKAIIDIATQLVSIPKKGNAESLNAGVAAGIIAAVFCK